MNLKNLFSCLFLICFCSVFANESNHAPKRKLRFFCLDFHGSVSADVKQIFEELGHEVVIWMVPTFGIGYSRWTLGYENDPVEYVDFFSWINGDKKIYEQFYERYKDFLNQFDGFIAAYNSSLALFYEKCNKPIIIINAVRYEIPFTNKPILWAELNAFLIDGVQRNKLFIVANNKGDKKYLKYYTDLDSKVIPSLCQYTKAHYSGSKEFFICQPSRDPQFAHYVQQTYPGLINNNLPRPYKWKDLYDYKGIIHFPYQISTMSIFEEYSASVPLFFPSKRFLKELRDRSPEILSEASYFHVFGAAPPTQTDDPNNMLNPDVVQFWIDNADFYDKQNMPYIQYFDSFEHLEHLLKTVDTQAISRKMERYNKKRKEKILKKWELIIEKITDGLH